MTTLSSDFNQYIGFRSFVKDRSHCPLLNTAFVVVAAKTDVALLSPLGTPTVLDQPVVVFFLLQVNPVSDKHQGVVGPIRAKKRVSNSTFVVEHTREIKQNRKRTSFVEGVLDDCFITTDVQVSFDLDSLLGLIVLAGS